MEDINKEKYTEVSVLQAELISLCTLLPDLGSGTLLSQLEKTGLASNCCV